VQHDAAAVTRYRTGHRNPRNLYATFGDGHERHIGAVFDPEFGPYVVSALNGTALIDTLERLPKLFAARRALRRLSYRSVSAESRVSVSSLRRLEIGGPIDLRTAIGVLRWLGLSGNPDAPAEDAAPTGEAG
jgi:hypothetical protein